MFNLLKKNSSKLTSLEDFIEGLDQFIYKLNIDSSILAELKTVVTQFQFYKQIFVKFSKILDKLELSSHTF